jgi:hypothetical protein
MTDFAVAGQVAPGHTLPGIRSLQLRALWMLGASGAVVFIEPSPYEAVMLAAVVLFFVTGLSLSPLLLMPMFYLIVINIGYSISATSLLDIKDVLFWILTSWYMAMSALFFSMVLLEDTGKRLDALSRGYVFGAVIAALAGIVGYFNLIPAATDLLTFGGRARGTFKDPNVLSAFLIYPAIYCLQRVFDAPFWPALRSGIKLAILVLAIFLAFSRAAWGTFAGATLLTIFLMYITAESPQRRFRIATLSLVAVAVAALAIVLLLSVSSTASLFQERASLHQPYDSGRFGRFGRHILGAIMALDYPLGIGPLQFEKFFPEATHNSFLNAFMSGGWLSGAAYPALMITTVCYGFRGVLQRTPWQTSYIAVYATLVVTFFESFIIDTDHWRHYFLIIGVTWGIAVANRRFSGAAVAAPGSILGGRAPAVTAEAGKPG